MPVRAKIGLNLINVTELPQMPVNAKIGLKPINVTKLLHTKIGENPINVYSDSHWTEILSKKGPQNAHTKIYTKSCQQHQNG